MINLRHLLLVVGCSLAFAPVAAGQERHPTNDALMRLSFDGSFGERSGRKEFAEAVLSWCHAVRRAMPTNSPAEDAWVAQEGQTNDVEKVRRLGRSPEFSRRRLRDAFETCVSVSTTLVQVQGQEVSGPSAVAEAKAFLILTQAFNNDSDLAIYATQASFDSSPFVFDLIGYHKSSMTYAALEALEDVP